MKNETNFQRERGENRQIEDTGEEDRGVVINGR